LLLLSSLPPPQDANVETVIVFRSCTPLAVSDPTRSNEIERDRTRSHEIARDHTRSPEQVCIFDHFIYRRAVPSARSCAALLLITAGAVAYIACDREFRAKGVRAYFWASVLVG